MYCRKNWQFSRRSQAFATHLLAQGVEIETMVLRILLDPWNKKKAVHIQTRTTDQELTSERIPIAEERTWYGERLCSLPNSLLLTERF
jgi:hypothetical protein